MKKMLAILIAGVAVTAVSYAATNVVTSANIVGYVQTQSPANNGFKMIAALPFDATQDTVSIQDFIANKGVLTASTNLASADKILIFDGVYSIFGLYAGATSNYWMKSGFAWTIPTFPKTPATNRLARGSAVWIQAGAGAPSTNVTMSGDVYMDNTFTVNVSAGFNMIAYPYCSSIKLTDLVISNATASTNLDSADKIMIFDGVYSTYGLYAGAGSNYWMKSGAAWIVPAFPKTAATNEINFGSGFWFRTGTSKTIGFTKNYTIQ
jgi:hypothetical protein